MVGAGVAIGAACLTAALFVWFHELRTPRSVSWRQTTIDGLSAAFADDLVLQHDDGHTVWATRGFAIYRSRDGNAFERAGSVRPRLGRAWGGYLASLRSHFGYQELVEAAAVRERTRSGIRGGRCPVLDLRARVSERTHRLRYFGPGKGRGLMAFGWLATRRERSTSGSTPPNAASIAVCIWKSSDEAGPGTLAFEFPAGTVRAHPHRSARPVWRSDLGGYGRPQRRVLRRCFARRRRHLPVGCPRDAGVPRRADSSSFRTSSCGGWMLISNLIVSFVCSAKAGRSSRVPHFRAPRFTIANLMRTVLFSAWPTMSPRFGWRASREMRVDGSAGRFLLDRQRGRRLE